MTSWLRICGALALVVLGGFCAFGFLATFEYAVAAERLPWQVGYALGGLLCGSGAVLLCVPRARARA
jgi:hypothetical protein